MMIDDTDAPLEISDPWEGMNRSIYRFNSYVDRYALNPVVGIIDAFQVLGQGGRLGFGSHQAAVFFAEGFPTFQALPALVAMPGGAVLDDVRGLAVGAVHGCHHYRLLAK